MASELPPSTTAPRGLGDVASMAWPLVPARELFELRYGRALVERDRRPGSVPVYGTNGRCGWHDTALFEGPGVVLGRKGQGPLGVEWCEGGYWVIDTAYSLQPLLPCADLKWAYYLISHVGLNHLKDGTSNPSLSRDTFGAQAFPVPPIDEQRAIAHILGTLDDKIELNRRQNETLEALARALFKSWFVDFDPVRAKAEGRSPVGMDAATAALFPVRFEDSELGPVPEGWRVGEIGDIAVNERRGVQPSDLSEDTPYIGLEHMPRGSICLDTWETVAKVNSGKMVFSRGEILFGKLRPYFRKVGLAQVDGVCSSDILVIRPTRPEILAYLACRLSKQEFIDYTDAMSKGTKMPRVGWDDMARYGIAVPPLELAAAFQATVQPMLSRIRANADESRTLAATRDALLPKLLSGELRVERRDVG